MKRRQNGNPSCRYQRRGGCPRSPSVRAIKPGPGCRLFFLSSSSFSRFFLPFAACIARALQSHVLNALTNFAIQREPSLSRTAISRPPKTLANLHEAFYAQTRTRTYVRTHRTRAYIHEASPVHAHTLTLTRARERQQSFYECH